MHHGHSRMPVPERASDPSRHAGTQTNLTECRRGMTPAFEPTPGRQESEELTNHMQTGVPTAGMMLTGESANQQRRVPISNRRAGLEVLGERDVLWKESRHEARQEFSGASVIEVLLLPELSRDERALASVKFEQIPLFYPRGRAAPLRGITPIATLERFVVYCSSELIISGPPPGRGPEGTGNCSSCYAGFEKNTGTRGS